MRATLIGATLCAATFMALPTQAQSLNDGVGAGKSPVQIEVRRAQDEDGPARIATRRPEPTTTGSATITATSSSGSVTSNAFTITVQ